MEIQNFVSSALIQERMKVREVIPHIGPIPIVIPLKLFLEGIDFLADDVTSRVTRLSPFLILQRLITINTSIKEIVSRLTSNESLRNTRDLKAKRM